MLFRVLALIFVCLGAEVLAASDSLLMVQAVWRHGSRTPTTTYPKDPIQDWPEGWGELTRLGFEQQYNLGQTLRARYVALNVDPDTTIGNISENYRPKEIYVRSTDVNRTLLSASANMLSFYPYDLSQGIQTFNPIPVHTVDDALDSTLNPDWRCPRQYYLWNLVKESPEYIFMQQNNSKFFDFLTNQTGMTVTPENLWEVHDSLYIELQNNKTLPNWVNQTWANNQTVYEVIDELNNEVQYWNNGLHLEKYKGIDFSVEIPKLRGGTLLWSIIGHFQQKWECTSTGSTPSGDGCDKWVQSIKYYAYSAHDTTIAALFAVFGFEKTNFFEDGYPHYTSCVTLELWQNGTDKTKNYIKAYYLPLVNGYEHTTLMDITPNITNCGECDIAQFTQRSKLYQPTPDSTTLCNEIPSNSTPRWNLSILLIVLCAFFLYEL